MHIAWDLCSSEGGSKASSGSAITTFTVLSSMLDLAEWENLRTGILKTKPKKCGSKWHGWSCGIETDRQRKREREREREREKWIPWSQSNQCAMHIFEPSISWCTDRRCALTCVQGVPMLPLRQLLPSTGSPLEHHYEAMDYGESASQGRESRLVELFYEVTLSCRIQHHWNWRKGNTFSFLEKKGARRRRDRRRKK